MSAQQTYLRRGDPELALVGPVPNEVCLLTGQAPLLLLGDLCRRSLLLPSALGARSGRRWRNPIAHFLSFREWSVVLARPRDIGALLGRQRAEHAAPHNRLQGPRS